MPDGLLDRTYGFMHRIVRRLRGRQGHMPAHFSDSKSYWEERYALGGNSGQGSYGRLARFKAEVVNDFVRARPIRSIVELGCGDGAQLALAEYPTYIGLDVSRTVIDQCRTRFADRKNYMFFAADDDAKPWLEILKREGSEKADLALSLDVIYHLVEDDTFDRYMRDLFSVASKYVIVYASNSEEPAPAAHVRHRRFTDWVERNAPAWRLKERIPNRFPPGLDSGETSFADFYIFEQR